MGNDDGANGGEAPTAAPRRSSRISASQPLGAKEDSTPRVAAKQGQGGKTKGNSKKRAAETQDEGVGEDGSGAAADDAAAGSGENGEGNGGVAGKSKKKAKADVEEQADLPSLEPIDIGDSLPTLTLKNEKGEDVQVADLAAEKGVVLFLVPKADTPGCTNQACGFRDKYPDFTSSGFDVYCLSADTSAAQSKWQTKKELPYPLLSDRQRVLIGALGAGEGGKTKRSHFIFAKGGKMIDKKIPVKPGDSPRLAMEFIKSL